jgi:hypothetical protein
VFEMVLGKLIGKKSFQDNLGVGPTFQSFNDSGGELSHAGLLGPPVHKPSKIGRAVTTSARLENTAEQIGEQTGNVGGDKVYSRPRRQSFLRAPSAEKVRSSDDAIDDENSTDEQSSGSEYSDDSSCFPYGSDQIPLQFHMSCADTVNAPAQFVVPGLIDNEKVSENENEGSQSDSSLLHFVSYFGDEYHSAHPDGTQSEDVTDTPPIASDASMTSKRHGTDEPKPREKQRRFGPKKHPGSRLKRNEKRSVQSKRDPGSAEESDGALPVNDQPLIDQASEGSHGSDTRPSVSASFVPETTMCFSPCPRSPKKSIRAFKRTSITVAPKGRPSDSAPCTPSNRPLRPLSDGVTCPKTNQQLPILNPLDSSNPSAAPVHYAVDLHRQSPIKQRQKYVLAENITKPIPCAEIAGYVPDKKHPTGSSRGSLEHISHPQVPRQPRRLSCPSNATDDDDHEDHREAEDTFERVMGLIDSHAQVVALDPTMKNTPVRKKKPTVEDMKRKVQKDRERHDEKKRNPSGDESKRTCDGAKRLQSPRRSKGRTITTRRQGQLVSTVSFDPTKLQSVINE